MSFSKLISKLLVVCLFAIAFSSASFAQCADNEYDTEVGGCIPSWTGPLGDGYFTIAVPTGWIPSDGLVIWNHGFESYTQGLTDTELTSLLVLDFLFPQLTTSYLDQVQPEPSLGPLARVVLSQGFAMAASSYTQTGWAVFDTELANEMLYDKFLEIANTELGLGSIVPSPFYLIGASLGGIVTMKDLESALLPPADGALLACGVVGGAQNWSHAFDIRMVAEAVCQGVGSDMLPTPWYSTPEAEELSMAVGLNVCTALGSRLATERLSNNLQREIDDLDAQIANTPLLLQAPLVAERALKVGEQTVLWSTWEASVNQNQIDNFNTIQSLTNTFSTELFAVDMWYGSFALPRLINDPGKLNGINPFHNIGIDYANTEINNTIQRAIALPSHKQALMDNYTPNGNIGNTKIVSVHTSGDGLVQVENQNILSGILPATQFTSGVVVETVPSHCSFNESEVIGAWNELVDWVATDVQPSTQDLQDACLSIVEDSENGTLPMNWDRAPDNALHPDLRCRIDPSFSDFGELLDFPRDQEVAAEEPSEFDGNTNELAVSLAQVLGDSEMFNATLQYQGVVDGFHEFKLTDAVSAGIASGWIHSSQYDPIDDLLYIPDVTLNNLPVEYAAFEDRVVDVYFQFLGNDTFRLLEFDPPLN